MEAGTPLDEAIKHAQEIGIAEAIQVTMWMADAAIKVGRLSTVLMNHPITPLMCTEPAFGASQPGYRRGKSRR